MRKVILTMFDKGKKLLIEIAPLMLLSKMLVDSEYRLGLPQKTGHSVKVENENGLTNVKHIPLVEKNKHEYIVEADNLFDSIIDDLPKFNNICKSIFNEINSSNISKLEAKTFRFRCKGLLFFFNKSVLFKLNDLTEIDSVYPNYVIMVNQAKNIENAINKIIKKLESYNLEYIMDVSYASDKLIETLSEIVKKVRDNAEIIVGDSVKFSSVENKSNSSIKKILTLYEEVIMKIEKLKQDYENSIITEYDFISDFQSMKALYNVNVFVETLSSEKSNKDNSRLVRKIGYKIENFVKNRNLILNEFNKVKIMQKDKFQNMAICIDFDGVIAGFSETIEELGEPLDGVSGATAKLKNMGYKIIVYTARPDNAENVVCLEEYLNKHGIWYDEINLNSDTKWKSKKPLADFYIDDRAIKFTGDWDDVLWQVMNQNEMDVLSKYELLLNMVKDRNDEVRKFDQFLRNQTTWLTSPASTRYHLAEKGGLLAHSVNVAETIIRLRRELIPELSLESCIISALFHDLGKLGYPGIPYYIRNTDAEMKEKKGVKYMINCECTHMDIATRSLYLISQHVKLNPDEAQAIRYHDGQYIDENKSVAHKEYPLTRLLQYADNWSGGVIEG